jgi:hypothetical protein
MKTLMMACVAAGALALASGAQAATTFTVDFSSITCAGGGSCTNGSGVDNITTGLPSWLSSITLTGLAAWNTGYLGATNVVYSANANTAGNVVFNAAAGNVIRVVEFRLAPWRSTRSTSYTANGGAPVNIAALSTGTNYTAPAGGFAAVNTFSFGPDAFNVGLDSITIETQSLGGVVPEPSTWMLMIMGFGLVASQLRRRHRAALAA